MAIRLECPSGLVGSARKIKGTELVALAEQAENPTPDGGIASVLGGCWLETVDTGPYTFVQTGDAKPAWPRLLKGDVMYAFLALRRASLPDGDRYEFDVQCERCRQRYGWEMNLADLEVKRLPAESIARVRAGSPFEATVSGRRVLFRLQSIEQEAPMDKLRKQQKRASATIVDSLCAQIVSVEGVASDIRARWRFLADLDMGDLLDLRDAMEDADCGVDTEIQTRCTNRQCSWVQDIALPFGRSFFAPRRKRVARSDTDEFCDTSSGASPSSSGGNSATPSGGASTGEAGTP